MTQKVALITGAGRANGLGMATSTSATRPGSPASPSAPAWATGNSTRSSTTRGSTNDTVALLIYPDLLVTAAAKFAAELAPAAVTTGLLAAYRTVLWVLAILFIPVAHAHGAPLPTAHLT